MTPARKHIPNLLTMLRLALAAAFFVSLALYDYDAPDAEHPGRVLYLAMALFIAGAITDALDGYLARRWDVVSKFGRIVDPFADKILVLGGFIFLAGPNFSPVLIEGRSLTGVAPWMVVVILGRELLVTTLRGAYEREGIDFSANIWGKLKMILQSIAIPAVLWVAAQYSATATPSAVFIRIGQAFVWLTVVVTVLSGVPYITQAMRASRR